MALFKKRDRYELEDSKEDTVDNEYSGIKITQFTPSRYEDIKEICNELNLGNGVKISFLKLPKNVSFRMLDFLAGFLFHSKGDYKRISEKEFLFALKKSEMKYFVDLLNSKSNKNSTLDETDEFYTSEF